MNSDDFILKSSSMKQSLRKKKTVPLIIPFLDFLWQDNASRYKWLSLNDFFQIEIFKSRKQILLPPIFHPKCSTFYGNRLVFQYLHTIKQKSHHNIYQNIQDIKHVKKSKIFWK